MKHSDLINHLYSSECSVCREAAREFNKYLKKYQKLKSDYEDMKNSYQIHGEAEHQDNYIVED